MEIINIGNLVLNNYLLKIQSGYLAIDTGYAGGFERYLKGLQAHRIEPAEIRYIFLTHAHDDHAGFLGELMRATGAPVILHRDASPRLLLGHNLFTGGCPTALAKGFVQCMGMAGKGKHVFPAVDVTGRAIIWDGKAQPLRELGIPMDILALPGHTADSVGLLSDDGALFCGDAAMNGFPSWKRNIIWIEDLDAYKKSWDTMIECKAKTVYPGHGKPFPAGDLTKYRVNLSKLVLR